MFPITQEAEIWNISSLDMYLAPHKISEEPLTILFLSKKNTCFLSTSAQRITSFPALAGAAHSSVQTLSGSSVSGAE